ncbi:MAG: LON peptidase substrate-binding domain-containing protein, partial [Thermomicrobiales bacterium]|nr:LON peptidase substrate-binding domain-containing protein [Thermomicrobiales bacterium]
MPSKTTASDQPIAPGDDAPKPRAKSKRVRDSATKPPRRRSTLLPVLVVDETVLLPHMSIPYPIEDEEAALVIDRSLRMPLRQVLVLTERMVQDSTQGTSIEEEFAPILSDLLGTETDGDEPGGWTPEHYGEGVQFELCPVGVIAEVGQRISPPGGTSHVILQGIARGEVKEIIQEEPYLVARVMRRDDPPASAGDAEAAMSAVLEQIEHYIALLPNVPEEVLAMVRSVEEPGWLADLIAFSPEFTSAQRQELLELLDPVARLRRLSVMIQKRLNVLNLRQQIATEAQAGMDRQQREYFLREQIRAIQKELGEGSAEETLAGELRAKIEEAGMPDETKQKALVQVERLEQQHPFSPEIGVIRGYLEWLIELPWAIETEDRLDLNEAKEILEADHYGLEKVKDRIIEYIAVRKLAGDKQKTPIICFVGPPGVGKTSLGR